MKLSTMREVMDSTGVTESALRYYNEKNLLAPSVKEETGRRRWLYSDEDIGVIKKLQLMKFIGMSVNEMKEALNNVEGLETILNEILTKLKAERDRLDKRILAVGMLAFASGEELPVTGEDFNEAAECAVNDALRSMILKEVR